MDNTSGDDNNLDSNLGEGEEDAVRGGGGEDGGERGEREHRGDREGEPQHVSLRPPSSEAPTVSSSTKTKGRKAGDRRLRQSEQVGPGDLRGDAEREEGEAREEGGDDAGGGGGDEGDVGAENVENVENVADVENACPGFKKAGMFSRKCKHCGKEKGKHAKSVKA
jgi:hypothetical protein